MRLLLPFLCVLFATSAAAQSVDPGRTIYASRCSGCHGSNGSGGELGPSIVSRVPARTDEELTTVIRQGLPTAGMPASPGLSDAEIRDLISFLRTLRPREGSGPVRTKIALANGSSLEGLVLNQSTERPAAARRRPQDSPAAQDRRSIPPGDLAGRLAELQRPDEREPLQPADADHDEQRVAAGAEVDLHVCRTRRRLQVTPVVVGRRDVRHERQRVLRARRGQRPRDLALLAAAHQAG